MSPGVYWFLDDAGKVLYVGKAIRLRTRLRSYTQLTKLSDRIHTLATTATKVRYLELGSELEALLTEAELIGTYQPPYNVLLKDDKSPLYIYISNDKFPTISTIRKRDMLQKKLPGTLLGPYQSSYRVKEVLQIARKIFHWCSLPIQPSTTSTKQPRACFYYHLGYCSGACLGEISQTAYQSMIQQVLLFLRGKTSLVTKELEEQMQQKVAKEAFEAAAVLRDRLHNVRLVTDKSYRLKPNLLLHPELLQNKAEDGVQYLQKLLKEYMAVPMSHRLSTIEGYDVSNTQGTLAAVALVTFTNGLVDQSKYKLFNIRTLTTPNDYHMLQEALTRRQNHPEWGRPQLLVIDGGKGQLRAALKVWRWRTPIISIVKNPDRLIIPRIQFPQLEVGDPMPTKQLAYHVLHLPETHPALQLVQRIRDEAHRFSKKQHHRRNERELLSS